MPPTHLRCLALICAPPDPRNSEVQGTLISHTQPQEFYSSAFSFLIKASLVLIKCYVTIDASLHITYTFLRFETSVFRNKNVPYFITTIVWLDWIYSGQKTPRFLLSQQTLLNSRRKSTNTILKQKQNFDYEHRVPGECGGQGWMSWPRTRGWLCDCQQHL